MKLGFHLTGGKIPVFGFPVTLTMKLGVFTASTFFGLKSSPSGREGGSRHDLHRLRGHLGHSTQAITTLKGAEALTSGVHESFFLLGTLAESHRLPLQELFS